MRPQAAARPSPHCARAARVAIRGDPGRAFATSRAMLLFFLALCLDGSKSPVLRFAATVALVPRYASTNEGTLPSSRTSRAPIVPQKGRSESNAVAKFVAAVGYRRYPAHPEA